MDTQFYIPISKVDKEQQMVYGYASTPDMDSQGEIISLKAIKKALAGYMKFPTIREMHDAKAVGTTKEAVVDKKGLYIGAKIVNKEAWNMVKEGVYRAFSIGGRVIQKIGDTIDEIQLTEISLVDRPANEHAVIELFKMEGSMKKEIVKVDVPPALAGFMKEYGVAEVVVDMEEFMHRDVKDAAYILSMACELCYTVRWYAESGRPTAQLQTAIEALKTLAIELLSSSEAQKFDSILATVDAKGIVEKKHISDFQKVQGGHYIKLPTKGNAMSKTTAKDEAVDETKVDETKVEETKTETKTETKVEEPVVDETKTEEPKVEAEKGEKDPTMEKLAAMEKSLKKDEEGDETDDEEEDEEIEKMDRAALAKTVAAQKADIAKMAKSFDVMHKTVVKMASILESVVSRVATVEAQPAAPKTAHNYAVVDKEVTRKGEEGSVNKRATEIKARLKELEGIRVNNLSKYQRDHQQEAFDLMNELQKME